MAQPTSTLNDLGTAGGDAAATGSRRQPVLFLVCECHRPHAAAARFALGGVDEVQIGRGDRRDVTRGERLAIRVVDPWMSSRHAVLSRVLGSWMVRDAGSRNGTVVNGVRQAESLLRDGDVVEVGHTLFVFREALELAEGGDDVEVGADGGLVTLLPSFARVLDQLDKVAPSAVSVVLHGESGTGKEVVARALHARSRRAGALVAVNCGALPPSLIEAELFGHRKGAFSGATEDRPGLVRSADRGTLFLDEIGDLPLLPQAAFLRVLQEREVTPVGASRAIPVDLRLVSASHRDVEAMIGNGRFRGDLYARIAGVKVNLPPLRERREDLGLLIAALITRLAPERAGAVTLDPRVLRRFLGQAWPLNIRELEKTLGAALALAGEAPIGLAHLPAPAAVAPSGSDPAIAAPAAVNDTLPFSSEELVLRDDLLRLLEEHRGNLAAVARAMGKARMQISRWLKRFGIDPDPYRR